MKHKGLRPVDEGRFSDGLKCGRVIGMRWLGSALECLLQSNRTGASRED